MASLNRKIAVGTTWNFFGLILNKGASTFFTVFLAALLSPRDFGLIAIVAVVFEVSGALVNSGFTQAIIRSKEVSARQLSTAFWGNLGIAFVIYSALFMLSEQISKFFGEPILNIMIRVLGLGVMINALRIVHATLLTRKMDFKTQVAAVACGTIVSGAIAVMMAHWGFGVWSLIAQMLASQVIITALLWLSTRWRPKLTFGKSEFFELFDFGKYLLAANLINIAFKNSYTIVIAKIFSPEITGLYYFSSTIANLLSQQLTAALQSSSFPALSILQDDNKELRIKYRQIIHVSLMIISPAMLMLMALADPIFTLLFDERWSGAVLYTQLLCIVGLLYPLHSLNINVLMVKGRSDLNLRLNLIKKSVQVTILFASIPFGVTAIIAGQVAGSLISLLPNSYYTAKLINYNLKAQLCDAARPVFAAMLAGMGAWWSSHLLHSMPAASLAVGGSAGLLIYLTVSILIKAEGAMLILSRLRK